MVAECVLRTVEKLGYLGAAALKSAENAIEYQKVHGTRGTDTPSLASLGDAPVLFLPDLDDIDDEEDDKSLVSEALDELGCATLEALEEALPLIVGSVYDEVKNLVRSGAAIGAYISGNRAVYALAERGIADEEVPGFSQMYQRNLQIVRSVSMGVSKTAVAQEHGVTLPTVNRAISDTVPSIRWIRGKKEYEQEDSVDQG